MSTRNNVITVQIEEEDKLIITSTHALTNNTARKTSEKHMKELKPFLQRYSIIIHIGDFNAKIKTKRKGTGAYAMTTESCRNDKMLYEFCL